MKASDKTSVVLATILLVVASTMVASAFTFGLLARQFPTIIGIPTAALLAFLLIAERVPGVRSTGLLQVGLGGLWERRNPGGEASKAEPATEKAVDLRAVWIMVVSLTLFVVLVLLVGFFVAVPIWILAFLIFQVKLDWTRATAFAAVLWIVLYLFQRVLGLELWPGVISETISGFVGGGILPPL